MKEDFVQYVWKFQLFRQKNLRLTTGERITVLNAGRQNYDAGPDFFNGQVQIDKTRWAGNIEIHHKTSDWIAHQHHTDEVYNKIILHVVWEHDQKICFNNGHEIPTLELKSRVSPELLWKYDVLKKNKGWIACENQLPTVPKIVVHQMKDQLLVQRLQHKSERIMQLLELNLFDWELTFYQLLAKYFGFKTNAVPFELLAMVTPLSLIRKYRYDHEQLSALIFGQAGMLSKEFKGNWPQQLKKEYEFLQNKHQLKPIEGSLWKFMRMRPPNFPSIRIAQFVGCLHNGSTLFRQICEAKNLKEVRSLFQAKAHDYWDVHFKFDVPSSIKRQKKLGPKSIDVLLINTVIPILFCYGKEKGDNSIKERAIKMLEEIKAEQNSVILHWEQLGVMADNAFDSQALLELKEHYCDAKNCLNCTIGNSILKKSSNDQ